MCTVMNEQSAMEKWKNATIANNFIFYKVMRNNPDVCKQLLEILLGFKIDHIEMRQEEEVAIDYGKKAVRLDVYAIGQKQAYNLEMQATDTDELPERSRFYQGALDLDDLDAGDNYTNLRTSYIIFICIQDIFGKGLGIYRFENMCIIDEDYRTINLNDRAYKYFFIAKNYANIFNEEQKAFLELVTSNKGTSAFTRKLKNLVEDAKQNTQWRKQFMQFDNYMSISFRQGKKEGEQQKAIEDARSFYANGASIELIAKSLNMTIEQVKEIVKDTVPVQAN